MGLQYASALDPEKAVAYLEKSRAAPAVILFDEKCARGRRVDGIRSRRIGCHTCLPRMS